MGNPLDQSFDELIKQSAPSAAAETYYHRLVTAKLGKTIQENNATAEKLNRRLLVLSWVMAVAAIIQSIAAAIAIGSWIKR